MGFDHFEIAHLLVRYWTAYELMKNGSQELHHIRKRAEAAYHLRQLGYDPAEFHHLGEEEIFSMLS